MRLCFEGAALSSEVLSNGRDESRLLMSAGMFFVVVVVLVAFLVYVL